MTLHAGTDGADTVSLTLATRAIAVPVVLGTVGVAGLALRGSWGWSAGLAVALVLSYGVVLERRLDLDADGLTLVPNLPLRPRQHFRWHELGSPLIGRGYGGYGKIKVPLQGRRYFFAGVFPRRSIDLTAIYELAPGAGRLHPAEVGVFIQQYRLAGGVPA